MTDWQVGDLALCLRTMKPRIGHRGVKKGRIYLVVAVIHNVTWQQGIIGHALTLDSVDHCNPCGGAWVGNFRKIKPDAEPCEAEFTALIKRMKPAKVQS